MCRLRHSLVHLTVLSQLDTRKIIWIISKFYLRTLPCQVRYPRGVNGDPCASISANGNQFHYKIIMYPKGIDGDVDIEEFHADFVAAYQDIAHKLLQGLDEYPLLQGTARFKNPVSIKKLARS